MIEASLLKMYGDCIQSAGNHPSCHEFFRIIRPVLSKVVSRVAYQYNAPDEIDDVVQEVNLKLIASGTTILRSLPSDAAQASAYFSVLAVNSARDFFRSRGASKRGAGATVSLDNPAAALRSSLGLAPDLDKGILLARIEEALPEDRREQLVFRLYYRQGLTAKEISAIPAFELSVKGVESMILRVTRHLRERLLEPAKSANTPKGVSTSTSFSVDRDK